MTDRSKNTGTRMEGCAMLRVCTNPGCKILLQMLCASDVVLMLQLCNPIATTVKHDSGLWRATCLSLGILRCESEKYSSKQCISEVLNWLRETQKHTSCLNGAAVGSFVERISQNVEFKVTSVEQPVCQICIQGKQHELKPGDQMSHANELLWQCHGYAMRFDAGVIRSCVQDRFNNKPVVVLEMDCRPGLAEIHHDSGTRAAANLCCEIVLTVCTERRLKRNRFLFYSHHPPQGLTDGPGLWTWCPCLPRVAFHHVLTRTHVKAECEFSHVLIHNVSASARTDEVATRQVALFQELHNKYRLVSQPASQPASQAASQLARLYRNTNCNDKTDGLSG